MNAIWWLRINWVVKGTTTGTSVYHQVYRAGLLGSGRPKDYKLEATTYTSHILESESSLWEASEIEGWKQQWISLAEECKSKWDSCSVITTVMTQLAAIEHANGSCCRGEKKKKPQVWLTQKDKACRRRRLVRNNCKVIWRTMLNPSLSAKRVILNKLLNFINMSTQWPQNHGFLTQCHSSDQKFFIFFLSCLTRLRAQHWQNSAAQRSY